MNSWSGAEPLMSRAGKISLSHNFSSHGGFSPIFRLPHPFPKLSFLEPNWKNADDSENVYFNRKPAKFLMVQHLKQSFFKFGSEKIPPVWIKFEMNGLWCVRAWLEMGLKLEFFFSSVFDLTQGVEDFA